MSLWYFSLCDLAWVAGSAALVALQLVTAPLAVALTLAAALVVLAFAMLQIQHRTEVRA